MNELSAIELSPSEKEAFDELKAKLPADADKEIGDDTYLLYVFLKEQNFDANAAETALTKTLKWRKRMNLDTIGDFNPPELLKSYSKNHRIATDKQGATVHYLPLGKLDVKGLVMSAKFADVEKHLVQVVEEDIKEMKQNRRRPRAVPYPEIVLIFDMEGLSFANATDKKGLEYLIRMLRILQDFYPGLIRTAYIINISAYFMIPCSIVKSCLSAAYVSRAQFLEPVQYINYTKSITKYCNLDGWKEELLKIIDADQLPAFLGGNKTDPDGNPLCKTLVMQGGKIDEKYYIHKTKVSLANSSDQVKKIVLARASFSEIELEVGEDGSLIEWEFETKTRDIGFGLFYKEMVNGEEKITELVPLLRIDTEDYSETGVFKCEKAGTYVILFDNSYSWIRSKEIYYRIKIISPEEHEAQIQK
ncbi:retinal-binding protein [Caerostris extrusa]|uniref:Retinal-binding protein n=1 Tax=Caerostris extrusa TaxID=172846 RepID=A0AAV4TUL9_CAEEX|nr:retinal-binding protein [Caerostris extrusa]